LVDILNSVCIRANGPKSPITPQNLHERMSQLEAFQEWVQEWKFQDTRNPMRPIVKTLTFKTCLVQTIAAVRGVIHRLITIRRYHYVCTRRFTQDCVENLFSLIRRDHGSFNSHPEALRAIQNLRLSACNMLLEDSTGRNCEDTGGEILIQLSKRKKINIYLYEFQEIVFLYFNR
jgi:hypothetical protein